MLPRPTLWLEGEALTVKSGPEAMVTAYTAVAISPMLSVSFIVTLLYVPAVVGVPEIFPVLEPMESPGGNPVADQV